MARKREAQKLVTIGAVGDVAISRENPAEAFARVMEELRSSDFTCCNFEVPLSDRGTPEYAKFETLHASPAMIEGFTAAGFRVVSLANNHSMDYGPEALLDTIELLDGKGILHAGAGRSLEEARKPAFFECCGMKFGFLSFATEFHTGYGAHPLKPGIAAIRRDALYGPPYLNREDVEAMQAAVREARKKADFVITAFHWGLSQSRTLTLSQVALGRAAIAAGARLVVGHHPHVFQAVEVYRKALILYSLGNFVFDLSPEFLGPATRESVLVRVRVGNGVVKDATILPVLLNKGGQTHIPPPGDPKGQEILGTLRRLSAERKTRLTLRGGAAYVKVSS